MLELLDEGDPQQSITASSRSAKRSRIVNNPAKSRAASSLQRQLHCAVSNSVGAPIGVGEVMPSGKTTSNVGSSLLVDRTDSSNPSQLSNDAVQQEEPTDFQEVQHSDAPPPSYAPATSLIGSITHLPATSQQQNVLPQRRGVRTFLEHSFEEVAEVETAQHLAKRQRCLRIGPPLPLLPEQLWVEDRESPAERDDDEDGHYQFEVGENFTRRCKKCSLEQCCQCTFLIPSFRLMSLLMTLLVKQCTHLYTPLPCSQPSLLLCCSQNNEEIWGGNVWPSC